MIYTPDIAPPELSVCKLGACEDSSNLADQLVRKLSGYRGERHHQSTELGQAAIFAFLMTGRVSMALMEREMTSFETVPYRKLLNSLPVMLKVAICKPLTTYEYSASASVYVHSSNPLPHITMQQLSQIYTRGNLSGDYSSWQQLEQCQGTAASSIYPLRLPDIAPLSVYLSQHHFGQRQPGSNGEYICDTDAQFNKLENTPAAIAIAEAGRENPHIRAVPVSDENGSLFDATLENMQSGRYPLTRYLHLYLPKNQVGLISRSSVALAEFMLSPAGQKIINAQHRYAALSDEMVSSQAQLLAQNS
ncbi:PstS family phosphate ABC transporter substrate-binding protein [Erwinia billingiae]|uniref:PstS family phosphate ABC transporter substrate-binding protein n=1 Tax=Erwinia billingiae TaxID=182337 RepID=UPI002247B23B|nr:substrate-binding domain-containing protein [Erwinia billingiae]